MSEHTYQEAPASVTIRTLSPGGYDVILTVRDDDTAALLPRLAKALEWLQAQGYQPTGGKPHSNGAGQAQAVAPNCPVHHQSMKPSKHKEGAWYCTARNPNGDYCKETA